MIPTEMNSGTYHPNPDVNKIAGILFKKFFNWLTATKYDKYTNYPIQDSFDLKVRQYICNFVDTLILNEAQEKRLKQVAACADSPDNLPLYVYIDPLPTARLKITTYSYAEKMKIFLNHYYGEEVVKNTYGNY